MLLDFWYPGGLGRYTRLKILYPQASNQSCVIHVYLIPQSSMMCYCPESMPIIFTNEMAQGTKTDLNKNSSTVEMTRNFVISTAKVLKMQFVFGWDWDWESQTM